MTETPREVVLDEPEYTASYHTVDLGEGRVMTFVHLDVFYMSHSILRQLKSQWKLWRQACPIILYAMADEDTVTWSKFISHFGFQYLRDVPCTDGKTRRLFVNFGPKEEALEPKD